MRSDMFELIIERPRLRNPLPCGSAYPRGSLKSRFGRDLENAPLRLGMGKPHAQMGLNENLAPLRRFLRSNVGRPWNLVHSEICAQIDGSSAVQKHVLEHLDNFVELHVVLIDGVPHELRHRDGYVPLSGRGKYAPLYVCPKSGLLRRVRPLEKKKPSSVAVRIDHRTEVREIDGVLRTVRFDRLPKDSEARARCYDLILASYLRPEWFDYSERFKKFYGHVERYAAASREPGKRELRRFAEHQKGGRTR
jgi:hypothetical protein